jgi:hypothetical protein
LPQSAANVLVHIATTANAGRRIDRTLRITQTSRKNEGKEQGEDSSRLFSNAPGFRSVEETFLLQRPKQLGRLVSWIDYVDKTALQVSGLKKYSVF